ncbi:hypothetical protein L195_g048843 [Trifolium pratense]|uniref:Uncharacterized protein n=1 Tax=Trifolium pratense TaxID=57577 RepID=A0A2K3JMF0_TRIPR|nr:hypothetical protein L195_g048843 [Trifolium pratense]
MRRGVSRRRKYESVGPINRGKKNHLELFVLSSSLRSVSSEFAATVWFEGLSIPQVPYFQATVSGEILAFGGGIFAVKRHLCKISLNIDVFWVKYDEDDESSGFCEEHS